LDVAVGFFEKQGLRDAPDILMEGGRKKLAVCNRER